MNCGLDHLTILQQAAAGELPPKIDAGSGVALPAMRELIADGCIKSIEAPSDSGPVFLAAVITDRGRARLAEIRRRDTPSVFFHSETLHLALRVLAWACALGLMAAAVLFTRRFLKTLGG